MNILRELLENGLSYIVRTALRFFCDDSFSFLAHDASEVQAAYAAQCCQRRTLSANDGAVTPSDLRHGFSHRRR